MKIGLFFGSFNPIHNGHLALARHFADSFDEIWLVVSPQNPLKQSVELLPDDFRLNLAQIATQNDPKIRVSDVEFRLPKPSYTIDTLFFLKSEFPQNEFVLIIGADNAAKFDKWRSHDTILANFEVLAYPRNGFPNENPKFPQIRFVDAPLYNLSATEIRQKIAKNQSIAGLVPEEIIDLLNH